MSAVTRVTKLFHSNLATVSLLESQLSSVQSKLDISNAYKRAVRENQMLTDKSNLLSNQLVELQMWHGQFYVSLSEDSPLKPISFPLKRACESSQSESEPSPKLDKRDTTEKPRHLPQAIPEGVEKIVTSGADKQRGGQGERGAEKPRGAEKIKGAGKVKNAPKEPAEAIPDISKMDFRIGKVLEVCKHPDADTLFIEKIDCGDGEGRIRQVVSGLVGKIPVGDIQGRTIIVCCNLKPRELKGVQSEAMVMCASAQDENETTEFIDPPAGCVPGEVILFEGYPHLPEKQLNNKKKILEKVLSELNTDGEGIANYKGAAFRVGDKGICRAKSLRNTIIK